MKDSSPTDKARVWLMPLGLFALALGVRLVGLTWGLPSALHFYSYHPDERQIAVAVANLDFFGGDFNPDFFSYPSLYIYLVYVAHFLGSGLGLFSAPPTNNVVWPFLREVMLMGRFVSAMLGAATVPLIFFIGKRIGGARLGALAALLLAFLPGYVQHSHFATVDVTATFFVALCLLFVARALDVENPQRHKQIYYAALFAGLAAATKYNAGLVFVAVLAAWWLARGEEKHTGRDLAILPALALLGFFIGCPFSIFDFSAFWGDGKFQGVYYELFVHSRIGHGLAFTQTGDGWWYHLTFNLPFAMTWPILLASLAGLVSLLRRRDQMALPMIAFTLFYFASLGFSQVRFLRYLLPILPVLCLCAAACFWPLMETSPRRRLLGAASSALLVFAFVGTFDALYPFVHPDPRDQAAAWMRQNANVPTTVGLFNPPWFWTPPLSPQDAPPGSGLDITQSPDGKWRFYVTGFNTQKLATQKPQWFVMSEYEWRDEKRLNRDDYRNFMQSLKREYSLRVHFKNQPPILWPGRDFAPHDWLYTNPEVRIYERRNP